MILTIKQMKPFAVSFDQKLAMFNELTVYICILSIGWIMYEQSNASDKYLLGIMVIFSVLNFSLLAFNVFWKSCFLFYQKAKDLKRSYDMRKQFK